MARKTQENRRTQKANQQGSILPFVSGLSIGLFVAFLVYIKGMSVAHPQPELETISDTVIASDTVDVEDEKPQFDFYTILPEREVKVPEWEPPKEKTTTGEEVSTGSYVFQVGSFQKHADADRVKAKLVLLGFPVEIQRVVINGQKIWFRVRVGPFKNTSKLSSIRQRLSANNMDYILLRIKDDA